MTALMTARQMLPSVTVRSVSAVIFAMTFFVPSVVVAAAGSPTPEFGVAYDPSASRTSSSCRAWSRA